MSIDYRWIALVAVLGCSKAEKSNAVKDAPVSSVNTQVSTPAADSAPNSKVTVLFFGTSLTAGYGLESGQDFPTLIQRKSDSTATPITAVNAGLSGETSAGALRRIEWVLRKPVDIVVLETGGNDALRALDPDTLESNIDAIVARIKKSQPKARILLVVMESPPNLGARYNQRFRAAYSNVAKRENLTLVPFLLDKVAGDPKLNQNDGVHPNFTGEKIVADNVWKVLQPVVREVYSTRPTA
jgi:acyl-CoA thioesterase-1